MSKAWKHFKKILVHKYWVFKYCCKAGIPVQGLLHDLSKFSPVEFFESVKYYQGDSSPIDACKKANGYSKAWLHHKGRNPHHYEYWQDNFDNGGEPLIMPYKYAVEMLCDYLGAGRAYMGKNFTCAAESEWWDKKRSKPIAMHPMVLSFLDICFDNIDEVALALPSSEFKAMLKDYYDFAMQTWNSPEENFSVTKVCKENYFSNIEIEKEIEDLK